MPDKFLKNPPMGWNSYDYYDTTVTEEDIKKNADYMAKNLKKYGWEYVVADIEWYGYGTGTQRDKYQYIPFGKVEVDEYSRLLPCPEKFPSSVGGKGFKPLSDYVHSLGLKFGIHIMRGIPRICAHTHGKILGTNKTANEICDIYNICAWNPDMYGICPEREGAKEYYNSICKLYAEWGVDLIKCDDICRMDEKTAKGEIVLLSEGIKNSGRDMVLSLSPGPALIEEAEHYHKYANMWRITDDMWDKWEHIVCMFERCDVWQNQVKPGGYPDCDMLPLGKVGKGFKNERDTRLTKDEQITLMTLWCIFRSPLMIGAELTLLDDFTLSLLTNEDVLGLLTHSVGAKQIERDDSHVVWASKDTKDGSWYLAVFNLDSDDNAVTIPWGKLKNFGTPNCDCVELWSKEKTVLKDIVLVKAHGVNLYKI